jgi:hypothetical protein
VAGDGNKILYSFVLAGLRNENYCYLRGLSRPEKTIKRTPVKPVTDFFALIVTKKIVFFSLLRRHAIPHFSKKY